MARFDLADFEWSVIQPLLPNKPRGVPRVDDRRVLNGIFWRLRTGAPRVDIPEHTSLIQSDGSKVNVGGRRHTDNTNFAAAPDENPDEGKIRMITDAVTTDLNSISGNADVSQ